MSKPPSASDDDDRAARVAARASAMLEQWKTNRAGPGTDQRAEHMQRHGVPHPDIAEFTPLADFEEEQDAVEQFRAAAGLPEAPRVRR